MVPVENLFVGIAAPMLLTLFILKNGARRFNLFFILGMAVALSAGFINPVLFSMTNYGSLDASIYVAPISEEILKAIPILVYLLIFKPQKNDIIIAALAIGVGFATLENGTYITEYRDVALLFGVLRGFATGVMHAVNTAIVGFGMCYVSDKRFNAVFTFAFLGTVITYHSIFNMLVTAPTGIKYVGWVLPALTATVIILLRHWDSISQIKNRIFHSKGAEGGLEL